MGDYRLPTAFADGNIEKKTHLHGITTDRKLAGLSILSACRLLPIKVS